MSGEVSQFVADRLGHATKHPELFDRAFTHGSVGPDSYERLEFLGDRVLGLTIAAALFKRYPKEPEGKLSRRFNDLVAGETCAEVGRGLGIPPLIRLGKQAREDGANQSDNVIGDVVEAVIGALYLEAGFDAASRFVIQVWQPYLDGQVRAPKHPKSALQELAAARGCKNPDYEVIARTGAHHAPRFEVRVSIGGVGEATADGSSKQEAETAAAAALLSQLQ
ncbi:ribonuclease III [Sphingomonas sp. F9_3S_D5_B_2]